VSGVLVDDEPVVLDCKRCNGAGVDASDWCGDCGGSGCDFFDRAPLFLLAANLAAAAMLERAYRLGREQDDPLVRDSWRPGCQRPAP